MHFRDGAVRSRCERRKSLTDTHGYYVTSGFLEAAQLTLKVNDYNNHPFWRKSNNFYNVQIFIVCKKEIEASQKVE